jgi:hypothetical protein
MKKFIVRGDIPKEPALIIKNQLLLAPGIWNGKKFTAEEIKKGISLTNWADAQRRSIIYGHRVDGDASPDQWLGYHTIPKYHELSKEYPVEGMYADLHLYDENLARKIAYGGAKAGVSERLQFRDSYDNIKIDGFINLSVVDNPACKVAYLNLSDEGDVHTAEIMSPNFINLSEDSELGADITIESNSNTEGNEEIISDDINNSNERRLNNAKTEELEVVNTTNLSDKNESMEEKTDLKEPAKTSESNANNEKFNVLEGKIKELESMLLEANKSNLAKQEPKIETTKVDEPKDNSKPVELTKSSNDDIVGAIKEMNENMTKVMTETIKASNIQNPQTVARTNPNETNSSRDDDVVTNLVKQWEIMHDIQNE